MSWSRPGDVVRETGAVSWVSIDNYAQTLSWAQNLGETNHVMRPIEHGDTVRASIYPVANAGNMCPSAFGRGIIVARIESKKDFLPLGIKGGGVNYYFVYRVGSEFRSAVLNQVARKEIQNSRYKVHTPATVAQDEKKGTFWPGAYECAVILKLKACFVDSPRQHIETASLSRSPFGLGMLLFRLKFFLQGGGGTQPWASCPASGCCCGGTNCHPD
ncbi:MAG TPA: hypothetical protein VGP61_07130 [Gemmatimonadales bacterium]|nr:hypothetical protein [Gemmatimonadales bacterium]